MFLLMKLREEIRSQIMSCEKYYNEKNELAVLISPGWGAGWSSWNSQDIAWDKRIVEKWMNEKPDEDTMQTFIESLGYRSPYMGGYEDLKLVWIPRGTLFCIHEYDGNESIETPETMCMGIA